MGVSPGFFGSCISALEDEEEPLALPARISFSRRHGDFSPDAAVSRIGPAELPKTCSTGSPKVNKSANVD
jgi:hypothetical protein